MIFVECKPDKILVKSLCPRVKIRHLSNKSEVCRRLHLISNAIGLIDEDPGSPQPPYMDELKIIENPYAHMILILRDPSRGNLVIILRPRLEEWLMELAGRRILEKYGFPWNSGLIHTLLRLHPEKIRNVINNLLREENEVLLYLRKILSSTFKFKS